MTVTDIDIARQRTAAWRSFFTDLAEDVGRGGSTLLVGYVVARRIATGCPEPAAAFDRLVAACRDLSVFARGGEHERKWLTDHGIRPGEDTSEAYFEVLQVMVEHALDELLVGVAA